MGYPRIHFAGKLYADANVINNNLCSYRADMAYTDATLNKQGYVGYGTNEIELYECGVTSVVYGDGTLSTADPVVGRGIIGNLKRPLAKMVEHTLNTHTTIFGMKFGIKWSDDYPKQHDDIAFYGKWTPSVLAQFMWTRVKCYSAKNHGDERYQSDEGYSVISATTITDIDWRNLGGSAVLSQLRDAVGPDGNLAVRITVYKHSFYDGLAELVGVIGVPSPSDSLGIPGERAMYPANNPVGLTFEVGDLCFNQDISNFAPWTQIAPFEVDTLRNEIRVDLSNSLPTDLSPALRDLGTLRLGISMPSYCVQLLGNEQGLPYASTEEYPITSAIYSVPVDPSLMELIAENPVAIVQVLPVGAESDIVSCQNTSENGGQFQQPLNVIMKEHAYFARPKDLYFGYLDRLTSPTFTQTVYVTEYGAPAAGVEVVPTAVDKPAPVVPANGVIPTSPSFFTDENGLATVVYKLNKHVKIPKERESVYPPCAMMNPGDTQTSLPVDTTVYQFYYCLNIENVQCQANQINTIFTSLLAFADDVHYVRPYTWVKDVEPILTIYARVSPMMKKVIDISDYDSVTLPHNIELLKRCLKVGIDDPSHMPTTRDLAPIKRAMILEWLDNPKYDLLDTKVPTLEEHAVCPSCMVNTSTFLSLISGVHPPRCSLTSLDFHAAPHHYDSYFNNIFVVRNKAHQQSLVKIKRPLFTSGTCNLRNLKRQLQTAVELEWTTLPIYLTSLYSIKEGYNPQIAYIIRSIAEQEMVHMMQAANILIALNGSPLIDHNDVAPTFPITGLPGGVLPNLGVTIEKMSLEHVYKVFMGIEVPQNSLVGAYPIISNETTVGVFYDEIKRCINLLGDRIFNPFSVARQVEWPGAKTKDVGTIVKITDSASAKRAIDLITSQGEGAGILNPEDFQSNNLAHFFRFEEIVCQRRLVKVSNLNYAYAGAPILFDDNGVWNMRPNPSAATTPPDSNCYDGSRFFHQIHRNLLRSLQELFNGRPKQSFVTVQLMESLLVHAKRLMLTQAKAYPGDTTTCGPVWDYYWPLA